MNRRTVLTSTGTVLSMSIAGCLDDVKVWKERLTSDNHGHCKPTTSVGVVAVTSLPDSENVANAEAEGFTNVETIAAALAAADAKYEDEMVIDASDPDNLSVNSDDYLAMESTTTESSEVGHIVLYNRFVTYENQTYLLTSTTGGC